jgi:hypothetical protein
MNPENSNELSDELLEEYDFSKMSGGVRGKYAKQYHEGVKLIMLEPDVAEIFPDAKSVNEALRTLSKIIMQHQKVA